MHSLLQHKLKGFTSNRVIPCTLQNSHSCTSPLAACVTQQESRPLKHWVKSCLVLLFCFVLFSPVRKIHSYLSRLVILIVSITWNNLEGGVPRGDLPKCALKTILLGRKTIEMQILFSYNLKVIFTPHGDYQNASTYNSLPVSILLS